MTWSNRQLPARLNEIGSVAPISLQVQNDGEAFADDVEVTLSGVQGLRFPCERTCRSVPPAGSRSARSPGPLWHSLPAMPTYLRRSKTLQSRETHSPSTVRNAPGREQTVPDVSYECERFRHGASYVLKCCLIRKENAPLGGMLTVRASSASLVDPVELRCPINGRPEKRSTDFKTFFRRRLSWFPEDVDEAVSKVLAEHSRDD